MTRYRQYRRHITKRELTSLKKRYEQHIKSRGGFLSTASRKILLQESQKLIDEADFWYRTKLSARNTIIDLVLLSEIASERELQDIFYKELKLASTIFISDPPLKLLLRTLFPAAHATQRPSDEENKWRIKILEEVVGIGLKWYMKSGFLKTRVHNRMIEDTLDIIATMSSGKR
jgi:hypothetical protein